MVIALAALNLQIVNRGAQRAHRLLAGLPGGTHLIEIGLRDVLHPAQALIAIVGHAIVTRGKLGGFEVGLSGGNLRVQLLIA